MVKILTSLTSVGVSLLNSVKTEFPTPLGKTLIWHTQRSTFFLVKLKYAHHSSKRWKFPELCSHEASFIIILLPFNI